MSKITTKAELARLLDLSRSTISAYLRRGMPEVADGRLDEAKCRAWIRDNVRVQAGLRGQGGRMAAGDSDVAGPSLLDAKRVRSTFECLLAEHRAERLTAGLVATDVAITAVAAEQDAIREHFRELPGWVADKLGDANEAPVAMSRLLMAARGWLHDWSRPDGAEPWDRNLDDTKVDYARARIGHVDCDGVIHHRPAYDDNQPVPPPAEPKKKKRRRSTQAIEEAIKETGAENEVDQELLTKVERAVPTMTLTEAKTRREIAEGRLKEAEYNLLKRNVVRIEKIGAALNANWLGVRNNVLGIASKVAPRVALLNDEKAIERLVSKEVELLVADLADAKALVERCVDA